MMPRLTKAIASATRLSTKQGVKRLIFFARECSRSVSS